MSMIQSVEGALHISAQHQISNIVEGCGTCEAAMTQARDAVVLLMNSSMRDVQAWELFNTLPNDEFYIGPKVVLSQSGCS